MWVQDSEPGGMDEEGVMRMEPRIGFQIRSLSNMVKKRVDYISRETGVTGFQGFLIGYLVEEGSKRDIFQRDVEKRMEISRASVTSVLQLLEKNGFIRRESVASDARLKKIVVTEKGVRVNVQIHESLNQMEESLMDGISEEAIQIFLSVIRQIKANLEQLENQ